MWLVVTHCDLSSGGEIEQGLTKVRSKVEVQTWDNGYHRWRRCSTIIPMWWYNAIFFADSDEKRRHMYNVTWRHVTSCVLYAKCIWKNHSAFLYFVFRILYRPTPSFFSKGSPNVTAETNARRGAAPGPQKHLTARQVMDTKCVFKTFFLLKKPST